MIQSIFAALDEEGKGFLSKRQIIKSLNSFGLRKDDPRFKDTYEFLKGRDLEEKVSKQDFQKLLETNKTFLLNAFKGKIIIPDFENFCQNMDEIYQQTHLNIDGKLANYIPQLARVNPENHAISVCSIDGQRYSVGNAQKSVCVQSVCKPINYCMVLEELGEEYVHQFVGHEPSGKSFNALTLNQNGLPHNPMINSGAIMCCSLIKQELNIADRFDYVIDLWQKLAGNKKISFNNSVYLSEKQTADRNFALGYFMKEKKAFPKGVNLIEVLEFYFQCCSIEVTTDSMSIVAGTLANGGICPLTGLRVFHPQAVKDCLALISSCGMYDFSGEFAFKIGLPAKSGVSGLIMIVIPNVLGICLWSPRLDRHGNSVRGIDFCKELTKRYSFHNYDSLLLGQTSKKDPRLHHDQQAIQGVVALCWAASEGDLIQIQRLLASGVNPNAADYDGRTALHLAASEGQLEVLKYLLKHGSKLAPIDRWGASPLDDAKRHKHKEVISFLEKYSKT